MKMAKQNTNSAATSYYGFCEDVFEKWLHDSSFLSGFRKDFDVDYLPEPYLAYGEGQKKLFVLNNNPGHVLENQVQARSTIQSQYPGRTYAEVARGMAGYYSSDEFEKSEPNAARRNRKIFQFAVRMGYDRIEVVETFFLHSASFDKKRFLKVYRDRKIVSEYIRHLKAYLEDKDVLVISSASCPITKDRLSEWVGFQCDIIGMDIKKAKFTPMKRNEAGNVSTAILCHDRKFMTLMCGYNNMPNIPENIFTSLAERN